MAAEREEVEENEEEEEEEEDVHGEWTAEVQLLQRGWREGQGIDTGFILKERRRRKN